MVRGIRVGKERVRKLMQDHALVQQPQAASTLVLCSAENSEHVTRLWNSHFEGKVTPVDSIDICDTMYVSPFKWRE